MIKLLYVCFEGIWRRIFGSDIISRVVLHIINILATGCVLYLSGLKWLPLICATLIFEFFYWSVGHGPAFDLSRDYPPSEEIIARYKKYFWNKWCEFLVPVQYWYEFGYDFLWMFFRYEIPAVLIAILTWNVWFAFAGLAVALIYSIFWSFHDKGKIKHPTEWAEVFAGLVSGFLLLL